jgi:hypothetical protein
MEPPARRLHHRCRHPEPGFGWRGPPTGPRSRPGDVDDEAARGRRAARRLGAADGDGVRRAAGRDGSPVRLSDLKGQRVVLLFLPKGRHAGMNWQYPGAASGGSSDGGSLLRGPVLFPHRASRSAPVGVVEDRTTWPRRRRPRWRRGAARPRCRLGRRRRSGPRRVGGQPRGRRAPRRRSSPGL